MTYYTFLGCHLGFDPRSHPISSKSLEFTYSYFHSLIISFFNLKRFTPKIACLKKKRCSMRHHLASDDVTECTISPIKATSRLQRLSHCWAACPRTKLLAPHVCMRPVMPLHRTSTPTLLGCGRRRVISWDVIEWIHVSHTMEPWFTPILTEFPLPASCHSMHPTSTLYRPHPSCVVSVHVCAGIRASR